MICSRTEDGWELVYQRAHALLAAMVVEAWRTDRHPARWFETLNAISQHDNGWQEWESGQRLHPNGEPIDFRETPTKDVVAQAGRAVLRAHHQDVYAGLLVSRHISELHESRRGEDEALDALLDEQSALRAQWRRGLEMPEAEEDEAYAFLKWGDQLSLILCERTLQQRHEAPIWTACGVEYRALRREGDAVAIEPWPYRCEAVDVGVDAFRLAQVSFESEDELSSVLMHTTPHRQRWRLQPA